MERLWREAEQPERPAVKDSLPHLPPAEHILHREELANLNRGYLLAEMTPPALPEGSGLRVAFRRRVTRIATQVVQFMLERHLVDEREFLVQLVRFENELAKKCDALGDEIREVTKGAREEVHYLAEEIRRLGERVELHHRLLEDRLARLEARSAE